jgi:hypothetical protein
MMIIPCQFLAAALPTTFLANFPFNRTHFFPSFLFYRDRLSSLTAFKLLIIKQRFVTAFVATATLPDNNILKLLTNIFRTRPSVMIISVIITQLAHLLLN